MAHPTQPDETTTDMTTAPKRKCIMVLGMHRSGTSALTRTLSLMGADLPKNLMPAVKGNNEIGFWEPQKIAILHDRMLKEAHSRWDDWRPFDFNVLPADRREYYRQEICTLIEDEYQESSFFILKEPRICRFVGIYLSIFSDLDIDPLFIMSSRHPSAVFASLAERDGFTEDFANLVWLRHELDAEIATRGKVRTFVSYEKLLDDWRETVGRVGRDLALNWPRPMASAARDIDAHLSRDYQHHRAADNEDASDSTIRNWVHDAYHAITLLETNKADETAMATLNSVRESFDTGAAIFGAGTFPEIQSREMKAQITANELRTSLSEAAANEETIAANSSKSMSDLIEKHSHELKEICAKYDSTCIEISAVKANLEKCVEVGKERDQYIKTLVTKISESESALARAHILYNEKCVEADKERGQYIKTLGTKKSESDGALARAHTLYKLARNENAALRASTSWRVTRPLRGAKRALSEKDFARQCAVNGSRWVYAYSRLKLSRMLDWPFVGPLLKKAKNSLLSLRRVAPLHSGLLHNIAQSPSVQETKRKARRAGLAAQSVLRQRLEADVGTVVGDPSDAVVAFARQLLGAVDAPPKVSVIMPTWNRETTVLAALRSALDQSLPPFEIIVSDDGSTDKTLDVIQTAFGEQIAQGTIRILRNAHEGVSAARNAALETAKGDLVAYLDSDNTWRSDFLLLMSAFFIESDEVSVAYAALRQENAEDGRILVRGRDFDRARLLNGNYIDMNVFVHRRRLCQQFGGFRRDLTRLVDWDLIIRYTRIYEPVYLPFIGVDYNLGRNLNNITNTQPLAENYNKIVLANMPERLSLGLAGLKLAYFVYDYPALSQTFVLAEIRELLRRGADLKVYYAVAPDVTADVDFEVDAYQVSNASDLASLFVRHERTVCHSHFAYPGVTNFVRPACQAAGVHYTFMPHAVDIFHEANRKRSQVGALGADPLCLKVFVYGDFHRAFLQTQGVPAAKIAYTFQAVDLAAFEAVRNDGIATKSETSPFRIVAIGRFIEKKGFGDLIRSMSLLPSDTVQLDLYGYGPLETEFRKLVADLKLSNVNFMGAVKGIDALADVYAHADLLAAPCVEAENGDIDGFPTVILEAMVAGVPVLATTVSAIPDYIRDGVEGLLVQPHDPQAIADAILNHRRSSPSRKAAMISRARALVDRTIGVEKTVQRLLDAWLGYSIDIVLVTFNNEKYDDRTETFEIIDRICERTTTNFTLTIIDNKSDDDFWAQLVDHVRGRPNIRLLRKAANIFCGPACNAAIAHGTAEFVIYVCSKEGFVKEHGWERSLIDRMRLQPDVGLAGHLVHLPKHVLGAELSQHPAFHLFRDPKFAARHPKRRFAHVQGGAKIIRRDMFEAAGGYNDATPQDHMDVELSYHFESLGYRLAQLNEIASVTQKTRPGLEAILDEKTVVAHPFTIDTAQSRLDVLKDRSMHSCNLCGESFQAFTVDDRENATSCPHCGSLPLERLVYRVLSNAPYAHRGARLAYLGATHALPEKLTGRMFTSVVAERDVGRFLNKIGKAGTFACIVVDPDFFGNRSEALWKKCAEIIDENGEIILAEHHSLTSSDDKAEPGGIAAILERRSLRANVSLFDLASERVGYDWRRLRRVDIVPQDQGYILEALPA